MRRSALVAALVLVLASGARAEEVAPGVTLIPGGFVPGSQPDGNTVVFKGEGGLVVVDTGRHAEHTRKVLDFAKAQGLPVAAIVNTHWHLDHVSGNPVVKKAYPGAKVYASSAIEGALGGFLARYRKQLEEMVASTSDAEKQKPWKDEIARIDAGKALGPDEVVKSSGVRTLAGRTLDLELESRAVTEGDVWIFDEKTRVLAAGDLVTLPVPFLDTACPERWKAALEHVSKKDFSVLVPGHGAPMSRASFEAYRTAFGNLLSCAASKADKDACVDGWMKDAGGLLKEADPKFVRMLADYYVGGVLRGDPAKIAGLCGK
jgi:glyoxylase-like metal-dependent hydrolase (beta-lactamase superfamily II)